MCLKPPRKLSKASGLQPESSRYVLRSPHAASELTTKSANVLIGIPIMSNENLSWSRVSVIRVALGLLAAFGVQAIGQDAPAVHVGPARIAGLPYDWTHDHVVFSNPGTEQEAISAGRHEEWQKVVNNPRYVMQQLRKNLPVQGPAAVDAAYRAKWISEARGSSGTDIEALEDVEPPSGFEEWTPGQREPRKKRIHAPSNIKRD